MAIMVIVSIRDNVSQLYMRPEYVVHRNAAIRAFQDEINRQSQPGQQNNLFNHPDDYDLYEMGHWDDVSGEFEIHKVPEMIAQGKFTKQSIKS